MRHTVHQKSILIADDHAIFIEGLKSLLKEEEDYKVVRTVRNGQEVLDFLKDFKVDLLILDLNMPVLDGFETLKQIQQEKIKISVLVLSAYRDDHIIKKLKQFGAKGLVNKAHAEDDLITALDYVSNNKHYFPKSFSEAGKEQSDAFIKKFKLTPREIEVLGLVSQEMTSKEIAEKLFISEETAKTHRKNLVRKLQVKGVAGLVKFALEFGLA